MAQRSLPIPGYQALTVQVTTDAAQLIALVKAQLGYLLAGAYRRVRIEIDPESMSSASVRIGDATLGTTVDSKVQKGRTLVSPSNTFRYAAEWDSSLANDVYLQSIYVQAVADPQLINVELWSI